jgi:hypothetical protein
MDMKKYLKVKLKLPKKYNDPRAMLSKILPQTWFYAKVIKSTACAES